nr:transporter substrate-binding domain-containing protein [uncultured Dethiosulfovibrio sp.]
MKKIAKLTLLTALWAMLTITTAAYGQEGMKMTYFNNFPPFSWSDENGKMQGILVDVMDEIVGSGMGISLSHEGFPWARAQQMVKEGDADGFVTVPTPARQEYAETGKEDVIMSKMVIFAKKGSDAAEELKNAKSLSDLKEMSIIDYVGNGWGDRNLEGFKRHLAPKMDNVFQMLVGDRGDICITDSVVGWYTLKGLGLQDQVEEMALVLDQVPFVLCVGKNSKHAGIVEEVDRRLKEAREDGRLQAIYDRYR